MGVEGVDKTKVEGVDEVKSGRRIRLLCFHGFRTSAQILEKQLGKWDASIHDLLDLTFLQAPFPAEGKSDVEGIFPPPYFEWFSFNKAFTEYVGVQEAVEYISKYMKQNGPFDGFLGFSQVPCKRDSHGPWSANVERDVHWVGCSVAFPASGAILSAYLVSLQEKGLALQDVEPLRLIVIISGAKFPSSKMELAYRETIRCPSIHFIGEKDYLKTPGEELVKLFQSPFIVRHSYGHTIPRLDADTTLKVVDYLKQERDKLCLPSRTDEDLISKDEDETLQKTDYCVKNLDA